MTGPTGPTGPPGPTRPVSLTVSRPVSLTVNGSRVDAMVEPRTHLADFVRDTLHLTGTHLGCEHGVCGACTVLIDGTPMRSCIAYAIACDGADVRTIEGFDDDPLMQALRDAFTRHHALQCGYCTPGLLITAHDVVRRLPGADEARVREELSGNLCRCTGYVGIVEAVKAVLEQPPVPSEPAQTAATTLSASLSDIAAAAAPHVLSDEHARPSTGEDGRSESDRSTRVPPPAPRGAQPIDGLSAAAPGRTPSSMPKGSESTHEIAVPIAPETLWTALQDVETVVRCLPGASLAGPANADPLALVVTVAIGPMRARFDGTARIAFDDRRRTGVIEGSGHDTRFRSTSHGWIEFSVRPSPGGVSVLVVALRYAIRGSLAQFSRGAVVDVIVERMLAQFAANLAAAAESGNIEDSAPIQGFGLLVAALRRRLRL